MKGAASRFREARSEAEGVGCRRVEREILAELGRLAASEGDDQAAADLLGEARRVVEAIADSIGDDELRSRFLAQPAVRELEPKRPDG